MRIHALDGNRQWLDGGAMYGNAPKALWARWSPPDHDNRIELACRAMLVETDDGRRVLCEAGIGTFFAPELRARFGVMESRHVLLESLAAAGVDPDDIDVVVLSHLHFDHAGGCLSSHEDGARLLFPRSRFVVSRGAWERACDPHPRDRASFVPLLNRQLAESGRLELLDGPTTPLLGPAWRFHLSEGHTPGLILAEVPTDAGPVVFAADAIPGAPWMHVPITMGYDRYPERLIEEKEALLGDLHARGGSIFFTHDPVTAVGRVCRDERGRYFATAPG
ncbi:MAG: MBL fold metallo-hydrolase [Myxococcales bacterium]|nr:MBL fold metallo-hydrolase [Myxococcales bacterium]